MRTLNFSWVIAIALTVASCSSDKRSYEGTSDSTSTQTEQVSDLTGQDAKLVKTASMDFKVKDVYQSSKQISETARSLGGLVTHHDINTSLENSKNIQLSNDSMMVVSSYQTQAEMYVRVPSPQLEEFMQLVASQAIFINKSNLDIDDRSIDFLSQALKQQSRQRIINSQVEKTAIKVKDAITLADQQDQVIDQKINNLRTDASVKYSTIQLSFFQNASIRKEAIANNDLNSYNTPFYKRFANALYLGCTYFGDVIIGVTHLWAFIVFGLCGWLVFRYYRGKKRLSVED